MGNLGTGEVRLCEVLQLGALAGGEEPRMVENEGVTTEQLQARGAGLETGWGNLNIGLSHQPTQWQH